MDWSPAEPWEPGENIQKDWTQSSVCSKIQRRVDGVKWRWAQIRFETQAHGFSQIHPMFQTHWERLSLTKYLNKIEFITRIVPHFINLPKKCVFSSIKQSIKCNSVKICNRIESEGNPLFYTLTWIHSIYFSVKLPQIS